MAQEAKDYLYSKNIPTLLESLLAGLMYHKPADPITFLEECLAKARNSKDGAYNWDTFHREMDREDNSLSLTSAGISEVNDRADPSPTEDGPGTINNSRGDEEEKKLKAAMISETKDKADPSRTENSPKIENNNGDDDGEKLKIIKGKPILFVLGGPGSGKGTQCSKIVEEFGFLHLSAGDLLRAEVAKGTEQGKELAATMEEGKLVPAEVTVGLLKAAMLDHPESVGYLIDGFPRELNQGELFKQQVCDCTAVVMFECPEEMMVERLMERGKTSGRVDDNEETIRKRFHTFQQATLPVIEHYQQLDKVKQVDATRSVDEVYNDVQQVLTELTMQK